VRVALECVACGNQRSDLQATGILAPVVDCDGSLGSSERLVRRAPFPPPYRPAHHGALTFEPMPLAIVATTRIAAQQQP
jgi:hypothetical protein